MRASLLILRWESWVWSLEEAWRGRHCFREEEVGKEGGKVQRVDEILFSLL